ncbi:MAG: methyl-accepting chemotaxis protein, partial [Enterobacter sp.]|nr:methyl-accepting chemotaxis protein [Enterobacter sp.]
MKDAMVRRQKIRVKTLMLLSIFLTVTVGFTATIGFMMWQWMAQQEVLAKNHIRQIAEVHALQVSKQLDSALTAARDMSSSALALREAGISDRQSLNQLLV